LVLPEATGIGLTPQPGRPDQLFPAVRRLFEILAADRPLVAVFEDVHWAEPTLLALIDHLAEWTRDAPLLVLCLARPELLDNRQGWGGGQVRLEPLSASETDELISELLADLSLDDEARSRIRATSEGNPLYVEQLIAMVAEGFDAEHIPPTINALLAARLDALPEPIDLATLDLSFISLRLVLPAVRGLLGDGGAVERRGGLFEPEPVVVRHNGLPYLAWEIRLETDTSRQGDWGVMIALGPGMAAEVALLQW